ncbi:MAG: hypothetical protein ACRDRW_14960 [Pseudonocardiaceae bacterium]
MADALVAGEGERLSAVGHWRPGYQGRSAPPGRPWCLRNGVAAIGEVLRAAIEAGMTDEQAHRLAGQLRAHSGSAQLASEPVRAFASAGTLSAEPNLAEWVEEILRSGSPNIRTSLSILRRPTAPGSTK